MKPARPRLGLPYTILTEADAVRLVAGEDFRYTVRGPGLQQWLPSVLADCDGRHTLDELLSRLDPTLQPPARQLLERLYGERVLVDGTAAEAHAPVAYRLAVEGSGPLADALRASASDETLPPLPVLCQDALDYEAAYKFNRCCLRGNAPWLWVSTGAMSRGYVSPVFLSEAGPCLACLLRHFQRLSPAPELYDALMEHARAGRAVTSVSFPTAGVEVLKQLVNWKVEQLAASEPPAALYRLHVLEVETMEVSTHRVFVDVECPECREVPVA